MSDAPAPTYLTPREASRITGQSTATLARYMDAGQLVGIRLPSGHRRYDPESVRAIVAGPVSTSTT